MAIPEKVRKLFDKSALIAVGTVDQDGIPNVSVVFWKKILSNDTIILIDNFMKATKINIQNNGKMCISFWDAQTEEAYKIKGTAQYHTAGPSYDEGTAFIQASKPGRIPSGVVEVTVSDVFDITPGQNAGNRV